MKPTYLAVLAALVIGLGIGVTVGSADAQQVRPLMQAPGGPLVAIGAASGSGNVAWLVEPNSRTVYACTNATAPTCTKAQLP